MMQRNKDYESLVQILDEERKTIHSRHLERKGEKGTRTQGTSKNTEEKASSLKELWVILDLTPDLENEVKN